MYPMTVVEAHVQTGDALNQGDVLFILRTATNKKIAIKATHSGILISPIFDIGTSIHEPMILAEIEEGEVSSTDEPNPNEHSTHRDNLPGRSPSETIKPRSSRKGFAAFASALLLAVVAGVFWFGEGIALMSPENSQFRKTPDDRVSYRIMQIRYNNMYVSEGKKQKFYKDLESYPHTITTNLKQWDKDVPTAPICRYFDDYGVKENDRVHSLDQILHLYKNDEEALFSDMLNEKCYYFLTRFIHNDITIVNSYKHHYIFIGPTSPASYLISKKPDIFDDLVRKLRKSKRHDVFASILDYSMEFDENLFETIIGTLSRGLEDFELSRNPRDDILNLRHIAVKICRTMPLKWKEARVKQGRIRDVSFFWDSRLKKFYNEYCIGYNFGDGTPAPENRYGKVWSAISSSSLGNFSADDDDVSELIKSGHSVELLNEELAPPGGVDTPLIKALQAKEFVNARVLVDAGADVNKPGILGFTALNLAIVNRADFSLIEAIINAGANLEQRGPGSLERLYNISDAFTYDYWSLWKPFDLALYAQDERILDLLCVINPYSDEEILRELFSSITHFDVWRTADPTNVIPVLKKRGVNIESKIQGSPNNYEDMFGTLFEHLIATHRVKILDQMIAKGIDTHGYSNSTGSILYRFENRGIYFHPKERESVKKAFLEKRQETIDFLKKKGLKSVPPKE